MSIDLAFNSATHPRAPKGQANGGQFVAGSKTTPQTVKKYSGTQWTQLKQIAKKIRSKQKLTPFEKHLWHEAHLRHLKDIGKQSPTTKPPVKKTRAKKSSKKAAPPKAPAWLTNLGLSFSNEIDLVRHVRTSAGVKFYKEPIGSPIAEHAAKITPGGDDHQQLLDARKEARAKYPAGHPERLKAERAVRQSRKSDSYRGHATTEGDLSKDYVSGRGASKSDKDTLAARFKTMHGREPTADELAKVKSPKGEKKFTPASREQVQQDDKFIRDSSGKTSGAYTRDHLRSLSDDELKRRIAAHDPNTTSAFKQNQHNSLSREQSRRESGNTTPKSSGTAEKVRARKAAKPVHVTPDELSHSEGKQMTGNVYPSRQQMRRGANVTTRQEMRSTISHGDKHVGLVSTQANGYGEVEIANKKHDLQAGGGNGFAGHAANVAEAKGIAAAEMNARKIRSALSGAGASAATSHSTSVRGWRNFDAGYEVAAGKNGVSINHQLSSSMLRSDRSATQRASALQKYMAALEAKGIPVEAVRNGAGTIIGLHVPNKRGGSK